MDGVEAGMRQHTTSQVAILKPFSSMDACTKLWRPGGGLVGANPLAWESVRLTLPAAV